jgi:hypothetical protein
MWNLTKRTLPLMVNLKELVFRQRIGGNPHTTIFPDLSSKNLYGQLAFPTTILWDLTASHMYHKPLSSLKDRPSFGCYTDSLRRAQNPIRSLVQTLSET